MQLGILARLTLGVSIVTIGALAPALTASAAEMHEIVPAADGWVNAYRPGKNHGPDWRLKTYPGAYETYMRFDVSAWRDKNIADLDLHLADVSGDATTLTVEATVAAWDELTLNYRNRPEALPLGAVAGTATTSGASFDLTELLGTGALDVDALSLRVVSSAEAVIGFGSRESTSPPRLVLSSATPVPQPPMPAIADVHASALTPTTNYASSQSLVVDADPETDSYIKFDLSGLIGQRAEGFKLGLWFKDDAGAGMAVHRVPSTWLDTELVWDNRPELGPLLAVVDDRTPAGSTMIDLGTVFSSGYVEKETLSLRISTTSPNGFVLSSSEGTMPPYLLVSADGGPPIPTPTPTPTSTTSPTDEPTPSPTPSPTPTPTPTPTSTPTPSPSPSATPTPTPTPPAAERWYFRGFGTDHGVGLSQYGARGRANAGQSYDQILGHYYSDTTLGTIDPDQIVRVLLATSHEPTTLKPARVWGRGGTWSSPTFMEGETPRVFPAASYAEMVPSASGWLANVYDTDGALMASAPTTDLTMSGTTDATLFQMKFRDSLFKYDLYRGAMRMLVNGDGIQAINIVDMDDYLKGVVPAEIPPLWAIESVKAQAVAARGYAYVRLKPNNVYDVRPTADNQVYGGYRLEHQRSNLAVDSTSNQVVMADGVVANTYFFTTAGGHTESNEFAWVNNVGKIVSDPISYLRGVPDVDENGLAYDRAAPLYDWQSDSFTWGQLQQMLGRDNRTDVGVLLELRFERGLSGRIYRVVVVGSQRTAHISGQALKGIYNSARHSGSTLRSSMFYLEPVPN